MRRVLAIGALLLSGLALAADVEIDYLLSSVAQSHCTFIRNGKSHTATVAADHLRMKYRRARWAVDNADEFIDRLASRSSMTGEVYTMQCADADAAPTREWLTARLAEFRATH